MREKHGQRHIVFQRQHTEFQRQTATARRYTASTNNVSLETEICGGAEQALMVVVAENTQMSHNNLFVVGVWHCVRRQQRIHTSRS